MFFWIPNMKDVMWYLSCVWLTSLSMTISRCLHLLQTASFHSLYWLTHLFIWRKTGWGGSQWWQRESKIQPRWSGFSGVKSGDLSPRCLYLSLLIWAALQRNCPFIKRDHMTNSNMQNSRVFVGLKGLPPFNWTFHLLINRLLRIYE